MMMRMIMLGHNNLLKRLIRHIDFFNIGGLCLKINEIFQNRFSRMTDFLRRFPTERI